MEKTKMKTYKKIDLFFEGSYLCSTNQSKTCKEAVRRYLETLELRAHSFAGVGRLDALILRQPKQLKAYFAK
jgi:hypothetical protein